MNVRRVLLKVSFVAFFSVLFFSSCEKEEGVGGQVTLQGQVIWQDVWNEPILEIEDSIVAEYPAVDVRVFLVYGGNGIYDDDSRTGHDGKYKFEWLREGTYTVYVTTNCQDEDCGDKEKIIYSEEVSFSNSSGSTEVPTIYLQNIL